MFSPSAEDHSNGNLLIPPTFSRLFYQILSFKRTTLYDFKTLTNRVRWGIIKNIFV